MIANRPGLAIRPGSMGTPVAGIEAGILADDGSPAPAGEQGNLVLKPGWPSMFIAYLNNEDVYRQKFQDGYYYTGDTAYRDEDGYFWFMGRSDDVINTAGPPDQPLRSRERPARGRGSGRIRRDRRSR